MVIAPSSWCRGEWVDYTFAANLAPCVLSILREKNPPCPSITYDENADGSLMNVISYYYLLHPRRHFLSDLFHTEALDGGVVLVRCGINWGTGVLVHKDTGTFLTCSHVVAEVKKLNSYKGIFSLLKKNIAQKYIVRYTRGSKQIEDTKYIFSTQRVKVLNLFRAINSACGNIYYRNVIGNDTLFFYLRRSNS